MGPRVAMAKHLEPVVFDVVSSFLEPEFCAFNTARGGLHKSFGNGIQKKILEYAMRPYPSFREWVFNPQIDLESLREFGEWCRDGCPVTVGSEVFRYRYGSHTASSSSETRRVHYI